MDPVPPQTEAPAAPGRSVLSRLGAVYARPTTAWNGLERQVQWWFPMLLTALFAAAFAAALHHRALLPMMEEAWQQQVANGNMQPEQLERMETFFAGPSGLAITTVQQFLLMPIVTLLIGLLVWFGAGFILGRPMSYRLSLEVAAWSGLITIPGQLVTGVIAWTRETMKDVHIGFGALLPDSEAPSRLMTFLKAVLDGVGPLAVWYVAVLVIGTAALSGAPRRQVAWVLGGLYVVIVLLFSGLGAMLAPAPA
jgi:hypothetical protein